MESNTVFLSVNNIQNAIFLEGFKFHINKHLKGIPLIFKGLLQAQLVNFPLRRQNLQKKRKKKIIENLKF